MATHTLSAARAASMALQPTPARLFRSTSAAFVMPMSAVRRAAPCPGLVCRRRQMSVLGGRPAVTSSRTGQPQRSVSRTTALAYSSSSSPLGKVWSFEEVQALTKSAESPVVIIDAREPGELQQTGHIPGAINIPVTSSPDGFFLSEEDFEDRFGFSRPSQDAELVVYCKAGVRSRAAASLAREAGWKNVGEYPGSWIDWTANGGAIERS